MTVSVDVCPVCELRQVCPVCDAILGDHDLDAHEQWRQARNKAAWNDDPRNMSWAAEIGRLIRVNERLRGELADAYRREDEWRRVAMDNATGELLR